MPRRRVLLPVALLAGLLLVPAAAAEDPKPGPKGKPNRLAKESSPYLLQHAHNPVDWYPWGPEAFDKARREKKLVFLSIGYSSCHWCHVMERESFSDPAIAKFLNEHFVCVKVDREERPDVDDVYMTALQVTDQQGGWPLSMFLTPDGKPIFGGTYFPPADKKVGGDTMPGFMTVLKQVHDLHQKERDGLYKQADRVAEMTADALERSARGVVLVTFTKETVKEALEGFTFDPEHGGTGSRARMFAGAKFPRPAVWQFVLAQGRKPGNEPYAKIATLTLRKMAEGGIYDHLGGGFHRYSTDRTWTVPHFEKMLYDNAQLVELYADAYSLDPDPLYKRVVDETLAFVAREMTSPDGAFYSALDADTNHKEGEFYVWTADELRQVLGTDADAEFVKAVYGATAPNFEEKFSVLRLAKPTAELAKELKVTEGQLLARLGPLKAKLLAHRAKRERPFLDTKVLTGWNGQMVAGYARAGAVFKTPAYTATAARAAEFLLTRLRDKDGRLLRMYAAAPGGKPAAKGAAYLEDYAFLVHGLLTLHDATGERRWLDAAKALADTAMTWHADEKGAAFFFTAHDHEKLFARAKDAYDGAQPSGNGVMARNLVRLWRKTGDVAYRDFAARSVKAFAVVVRTSPASVPGLVGVLDELLAAADADPTVFAPQKKGPAEPPKKARESADVVTAAVKEGAEAGGARTYELTLAVAAPWHLYANPVGNDMLKDNATAVEVLAGGKPVAGASVTYPKGKPHKDPGGDAYAVYEGTVTVTVTVPAAAANVEFRVKLLACREGTCLLPSNIKLTAK